MMSCLLILTLFLSAASGEYGNNDLFTSLEAMRRLWTEEKLFIAKMETTIENLKEALPIMEKYVENHKKLMLDQEEPNVNYLGHPINSFYLIKHSAIGWKQFHNLLPKFNESLEGLKYIVNRENQTKIPDHSEIDGAALALARLHTQYDLNTEKLVKDGITETFLNMKHVISKPSILKLSSKLESYNTFYGLPIFKNAIRVLKGSFF